MGDTEKLSSIETLENMPSKETVSIDLTNSHYLSL